MHRTRCLAWFVLLLAATVANAASQIPEVKFEKYVLPNGLQVILHENHATPIVTVNLWYHVGAKNERPGRTGFAHLFEHMMFQGSQHHDSDYFGPFQQAGGKLNGSTSQDRTNYWETVPANHLELALWMESDRMGYLLPSMSQKKLDNQRDVVRNERRQSYENRPYGLVEEVLLAAMFPPEHPYSWPTIGSMNDLGRASRDDIAAFFRRYYTPSNASLCIAGDFDPAVAKKLVEKYFGPLPGGPKLEKMKAQPAELQEEKRIVMTDRVGLPRVYMVWPTVADFAEDEAALSILGEVLSTGKTSRFEQTLVRKKQMAQSVGAGQESQEIAGYFAIEATAQPGHKPAEIEAAILDEIGRIQKTPPTAEEVARAQNRIETAIIHSMESHSGFGGLADQLNQYNVTKGEPDYFSKNFDRYQKVTPEDVQRVARKYLGAGRLVLEVLPGKEVTITPDPRIPAEKTREKLAKQVKSTKVSTKETDAKAEDPSRVSLPKAGAAPKFALPPFHRAKLSNGMSLIVVERHELPIAALNVMFPVGKTADPAAKLGLVDLMTAIWDEGTKTRTGEQIADELGGMGATMSFDASWDTTSARLFSLKRHLPKALDIFADVLRHPLFPEKDLEREKGMMLGQLMMIRNEPTALAHLAVGPTIYGAANPYGRCPFGTPATLKATEQADLASFFKAHYRSEQATLIAVGDVTTEELTQELERVFAGWKPTDAETPKVEFAAIPEAKPTRILLIDKPGAAQSVISVAQIGAERRSPDYYAINVMNAIFGGQFMSRLNLNLREDKGFTYGARSSFDWRVYEPGTFVASSSVKTDDTAAALVEFLAEIDGIRGAKAVTPEELKSAKDFLTQGFPSDFETASQIAQRLETLVVYNLPDNYYNTMIPKFNAVTNIDVLAAAEKYLHPDSLSIIIVADRGKVEKSLAKLPSGKIIEFVQFDENFKLVPAK